MDGSAVSSAVPPHDGQQDPPAINTSALAPIQEIKGITPPAALLEASNPRKPSVLKNAKEAAEQLAKEDAEKLAREVDFNRQIVLVFAWRGSGQDKLDPAVAESYPEQIFFTYRPGRTRDLRPHARVFALRANVNWSVK